MSDGGATFYTSDELARRARSSQKKARSRDAKPEDAFLVTGPTPYTSTGDPNLVTPITEPEMFNICTGIANKSKNPRGPNEGKGESRIRRVLERQDPSGAIRFSFAKDKYASDTLPGGAPIVDHLFVRAEAEADWAHLLPGLASIRQNRSPSIDHPPLTIQLTLGVSDELQFKNAIQFLKKRVKEIQSTYHVCQLAGDSESITIPLSAHQEIFEKPAGTPHMFRLAESGHSAKLIPTRLVIGHIGWCIDLRLPIDEDKNRNLLLVPGKLLPEFWELLREANSLVGVGITNDLNEFLKIIKALFGESQFFPRPIELQPIVRLAGFNLIRYAVGNLVWVFLGAILPKGECSNGDGRWHQAWTDLSKSHRAYLSGDVGQVAATFWVATNSWLMRIFPDIHVVTQISKISSGPELMNWWVLEVITHHMPKMPHNKTWEPGHSPTQMLEKIFLGIDGFEVFSALAPDWPSIVAGGCRFLHTARSFLIDRLPFLRQLDSDAWPLMYMEQYHLFTFGRREVSPQPSPVAPTTSPAIGPNPGMEGMISGPAREISCKQLAAAVVPGYGLRGLILEYARAFPSEGAKLLTRLDADVNAASYVLPYTQKVYEIVWGLRDLLTLLGKMPSRSSQWKDPYPLRDVAPKVKQFEGTAHKKISQNKVKALRLIANSRELTAAIAEGQEYPLPRLDQRSELKNLLHPKGTARLSRAEQVYMRIGAPAVKSKSRKRTHSSTLPGNAVDLRDHLRQRYGPPPTNLPPSDQALGTVTIDVKRARSRSHDRSSDDSWTGTPRKIHFRDYLSRDVIPTSLRHEDPIPERPATAAAAFIHIRVPDERTIHRSLPVAAAPTGPTKRSEPAGSNRQPEATRPLYSSGLPNNRIPELAAAHMTGYNRTSYHSSSVGHASGRGTSASGDVAVIELFKPLSINLKRLFIVGGEQARRMSCTFRLLLPHLEVRYINVPSADSVGFSIAASELNKYNLQFSYIIAWLYDERCFIQFTSGADLEISQYDLTAHCMGKVGVISRDQLISLCDESRPLIVAMQAAVGVNLLGPIPRFLATPCCNLVGHCTGMEDEETAKRFCSDVKATHLVIQRWVSEEGFGRTTVMCPHLELLLQLRADPWEGWLVPLLRSYGQEPEHLSHSGYSHLSKQLWERIEETYLDDGYQVEPGSSYDMERGQDEPATGPSNTVRGQGGWHVLGGRESSRKSHHAGSISMFHSSNYGVGDRQPLSRRRDSWGSDNWD